ncbi:MAG: RidA family protein [Candidatus Competibacterales bacterium]
MSIQRQLAQLGLALPDPPNPAGSYRAAVCHRGLLWISGQFPMENGTVKYRGRVGAELSADQGYEAARLAGLNVLAQIHRAVGFERLETLLRVEGHVSSAPGFSGQPKVLDGASELFTQILGDRGRHTRTAFAPQQLPLDATVELVVTAGVVP